MTKLEEKVFRDPVYGYVHVYDQLIWDLIQTKEVQRYAVLNSWVERIWFSIRQNIAVFHIH